MEKAFRRFEAANDKVLVTIDRDRIGCRWRLSDASLDWRLVQEAVELRDGFLMRLKSGYYLIPKDALAGEFAELDLVDLLRERVARYRIIDRAARSPARPKTSDSVAVEVQ